MKPTAWNQFLICARRLWRTQRTRRQVSSVVDTSATSLKLLVAWSSLKSTPIWQLLRSTRRIQSINTQPVHTHVLDCGGGNRSKRCNIARARASTYGTVGRLMGGYIYRFWASYISYQFLLKLITSILICNPEFMTVFTKTCYKTLSETH